MLKWISFFVFIAVAWATGPPYLPRHGLIRQHQPKVPVTIHKEFYVYSAPDETRTVKQQSSATGNAIKREQVTYVKSPENHINGVHNYQRHLQIAMPLDSTQNHGIRYHTAEEVINAIVQKYGNKPENVQHINANTILIPASLSLSSLSLSLPTVISSSSLPTKSMLLLPSHIAASRSYLSPTPIEKIELPAATALATNVVPLVLPPTPPNTPVHKNYAHNFLPEGEDVVPGSSYIPLVLKH